MKSLIRYVGSKWRMKGKILPIIEGIKGKAILSGYDNSICSRLESAWWTKKQFNAVSSIGNNDVRRTECLWIKDF